MSEPRITDLDRVLEIAANALRAGKYSVKKRAIALLCVEWVRAKRQGYDLPRPECLEAEKLAKGVKK